MNDDDNPQQYKIEDSEGYVDRRIKETILELREKVERRSDELMYANATEQISDSNARAVYYRTVRQLLVRIEPLLRNEELNGATQAYLHVNLGTVEVPPPPIESDKPQRFLSIEEKAVLREYSDNDPQAVLHRQEDVPVPKEKPVRGLKDIIEQDGKGAKWKVRAIEVDGKEVGRTHRGDEVTLSNYVPYDYGILINAIRVLDSFLDNADLGLSINEGPDDPLQV